MIRTVVVNENLRVIIDLDFDVVTLLDVNENEVSFDRTTLARLVVILGEVERELGRPELLWRFNDHFTERLRAVLTETTHESREKETMSDDDGYTCGICGASFATRAEQIRHISDEHGQTP